MKYKEVLDRLRNLINTDITQAELCSILDVNQSTMSNRSNRNSDFPLDEIEKLNNFFNVNLFTNTLQILNQDEAFLTNSATFTQKPTNVNNQQQFEFATIQYFSEVYLSAGYGVEVYDETSQTVVIDSQFLISSKGLRINPKYCKMVRVCGNSMYPEYHHGDRVIIDESDKYLTDGQIYAFRYDGQCYVKEINRAGNKIKCISVNKDYEPFFIERDIDFQVFGRILPRVRL